MTQFSVIPILLICYFGVHGQDDDEATRLAEAREAFNKINNGCYNFQYSQSCFCLTCSVQSMDIEVSNNAVQQVSFAEGDDFALDEFCSGDQDWFDSVLESQSRTIDDLFDEIQDAIDRDLPFEVTYHPKIGMPLEIFIDRVPDAIDDEIWYRINCIQFIKNCNGNKGGPGRRKRTRFNRKNEYSCKNVPIPNECPFDVFECERFYDGCNTCSCDGADIIGCTKRICETYANERCLDCESNTQWITCGKDCDATCDDLCESSSDCQDPRCQCPASSNVWDGTRCIPEDACPPLPPQSTT